MSLSKEDRQTLENLAHHLTIKMTDGWQNFSENIKQPQALVLDIPNIAALQEIMRAIYEINLKKTAAERIIARTAAGGKSTDDHSESYSFTPVNEADIVIRLTGDEFRKMNVISQEKNIVNVGASLQIGELDQTLYDKYDMSLPTSSLIPYVTVGGLSATAGHGTGKDQPSFAGLIKAMTICLPNGKMVRIDESDKDFATIRAGHLGLFGVVLSVELQCVPAQKLQCIMEARSVPQFIDAVKKGLFQQDPYVSVMYVPTYFSDERTRKNVNNVIIYRWRPVDKSEKNVNFNPHTSRAQQDLEIHLSDGLGIDELLTQFPKLIPPYMRYLVSQLKIGTKDSISLGDWPAMAHYQTTFPHDLDEIAALFTVKDQAENGQHGAEIVTAMEKIVSSLQQASKHGHHPITYAIYFRFFAGTNGGLSSSEHQHGQRVCAVDITSHPKAPGFQDLKNELKDFFVNEMNAKLHWGKNIDTNIDYQKMFGENFTAFCTTLTNWCQQQGIEIEKNPLINAVFSHVLQFRSIPLAINQFDDKPNTSMTTIESCVKKLLPTIATNTKEGKELYHQLQKITQSNVISESSQGLFSCLKKPKKDIANNEKKSRCTMM
ncbi:MAG: hypothetical protein ACD_46C00676G0003 [uncultured bacterium]|nr:MAG: hypothetical protein ACD_46C00676G0003 [uncultured bacterium]